MRWRGACLGLLLAVVGGCSQLVDSDAARVCRTVLPVFDADAVAVEIIQTQLSTAPGTLEQTVVIDYQVRDGDGIATARRVSCNFVAAGEVKADPVLGVAARLSSIVTDDGAVGPLRLHLLKQNWMARGAAGAADPAPFATLGVVPHAPRWLAITAQHLFSALPIISIYALLAAAYALVYGLVGRINLAFGELTILAGYGAFLGFSAVGGGQAFGLGLVGAIAFGLFAGVTNGAALGRWVLAPLVGRPGQHVLIATIGLSMFWSELVRLTQGTSNRWIGPIFNRPLALLRDGDYIVTVTPMALILPVVAAMAAVALLLVMRRTRFGRQWRAFADDPVAAALFGVSPQRLIFATMIGASACAALAGILTTFYYGGVGFAGGQTVGLKALIAALLGGIGSVPGALFGGVVLGLLEAAWSAFFAIEMRDPAIFVLLVVLIALRPEGLWRTTRQ